MTPSTLFTARQAQVLDLLMQGLNNVEIGKELKVSKSAVKHHVSCMARRCGISGSRLRTALVMKFRADPPECIPVLSDTELEIFRLVALGKSNPEIGKAIGRSEHSVRKRLSDIFDKFGVWNRMELALKYPLTTQTPAIVPSQTPGLYRYCNQ